MTPKIQNLKLAVIGLGYVGLPLALAFAKQKRHVIGFDINEKRIKELKLGIDVNLESKKKDFKGLKYLNFTKNTNDLNSVNCFIVTVPTPIDKFKKPNLKPLLNASKIVSKVLKKGDIVIFESTVYPGCIEEKCVPVLEEFSNLKYNKHFFCGYSPERINPGDKKHTISNIKKITSGSTTEVANLVDDLYGEIISVGTFKAKSIKVAEAAKIIENTQRDLNIALINELSMLFSKLNIDTQDVLEAAETKWNFLPFKPGLVGGHCIGVDPYYLTYKAEKVGYTPKVILAGRKINDNMGNHITKKFIQKMKKKRIKIIRSKVLVMGLTFKENCTDIRNSGVKSVIQELKKHDCIIDLYDPWANNNEIKKVYGTFPKTYLNQNVYDGVIIAVSHKIFKDMGINTILKLCKKNHVIFDLKSLFPKDQLDLRL